VDLNSKENTMAVRRNRIVKPFRGQLYDMVVKNFAYVPVLNALGQQVEETDEDGNPIKGKIVRVRRKEVTDAFEVYYNICLVDEYFKMLYEGCLKAGQPPYPMSTLKKDFAKSWRYLLQKYAMNAPRGTRELATKVEARLGEIDKNINGALAAVMMGSDINEIMGGLKGSAGSTDYRRTIGFYADFIKQAFNMLGLNVVTEVKSNPKFNIRYVQFSEGDEISDLIANSSEMVAKEITKAEKLKKLRDAKLKSSLLEQGYHVETTPVYLPEGVAYLTVAYDQQATKIPKPRSKPKAPVFAKKDKEIILALESLVMGRTLIQTISSLHQSVQSKKMRMVNLSSLMGQVKKRRTISSFGRLKKLNREPEISLSLSLKRDMVNSLMVNQRLVIMRLDCLTLGM
jgi:hypothetical protein